MSRIILSRSKALPYSVVIAVALLALVLVGVASAEEPEGAGPVAPAAPLAPGFITATIPFSQVVTVGDSFAVPIIITDAVDVAAFDFTVEYTPTVVTATGFTVGHLADGGIVPNNWGALALQHPQPNRAYFGAIADYNNLLYFTGDGTVGWIAVTAQAAGTSKLDLIHGKITKSDFSSIVPPDLDLFGGWVTVVDQSISGLAAGSDSPTAEGDPTQFTATIATGTGVSYAWDFGNGIDFGVGPNPNYIYPNPGAYTAIVTASNTAGSTPATTTVEIHEPIAFNAANSGLTDVDSPVYFTATITSDPLGVTYAWDFGDGAGTDVGANPSYAYGAAGPYTATVTATNAAGPVVDTTPVTIQDIPIAGLTASSDSPTPLGSPTQFTATITAGTGVAYTWDFGDGVGTSAVQNPSYTYGNFGTFTATVTATNSSGAVAATTVVVVSSDPDISVPSSMNETLNPNETSVQTLTIRNVGGAVLTWNLTEGPPSRPWLDEAPTSGSVPPGGSTDVAVTFDSTGQNPGIYNGTLRITSNDQDEPTVSVAVTLTVTCVPVTAVDFDYTPSNPSAGDTVNFTAIVTPSTATLPIAYTWDLDGSPDNGQAVAYSWGLSGTYSVALTVTNCSAAVASHSEDVDVAGTLDITVNPPSLNATLNPGGSTTRTLIIENIPGATANLNWNLTEDLPVGWLSEIPPNGTLGPGESVNVDVVFDASALVTGTYTTLLQVNSNDPDEPQVIVTATLVVTTACIPAEGANFSYNPPAPQAGEEVTFFGSVTRGTEPVSYIWDFGGGNTASGQVVTYSWNFSGTYPVTVNAANACGTALPTTRDVGITGEPDITVAPLALSASLETGSSTTRQLVIGNAPTATANLNWSVTEVPTDVAWLSEAPGSGTASPGVSDTVNVTFDASGLGSGTYNTTLRISSNDPDESPVDVNVTLTVVSCAPVSNVDFTVSPNPVVDGAVTFTGTVDAGSRLPIKFTFNFGDGTAPVSSWEYDPFYVVEHTFTTSDTYQVVMTATNNCPSEDTATHAIVVLGEPDITVNPLSLSALLNPFVGASQTNPHELIISNAADATAGLRWTLVETPMDEPWLEVAPASGLITPSGSSSIKVTFNTSPNPGLGIHTTTLRIRSNDLDTPEVDVDVTLEVIAGCIEIDGADFDFAPTGPITTGDTVVFTASVEQGSSPFDYTWDFGDGTPPVVQSDVWAQTSVVAHTYTGTEEGYHVRMRVTNACSEKSVTNRVGRSIIYLPLVVRNYPSVPTCNTVSITNVTPSAISVTVDAAVYFTATVTGDTPITYTWDFGDSTPVQSGVGLITTSHTYTTTGAYTVTLDVGNTCPSTDTQSITVTVTPSGTFSSISAIPTFTVAGERFILTPITSLVDEIISFISSALQFDVIVETWDFRGAYG